MIAAILATTLFFGPIEDRSTLEGLTEQHSSETQLVFRASPTRLVAVNPSVRPQVLWVRDVAGDRAAATVVPAGGDVEFRFPWGTLDGLDLEVVSRHAGGISSSGAIELDDATLPGFDAVFVESSEGGTQIFGRRHGGLFTIETSQGTWSCMDAPFMAVAPTPRPTPRHVPVVDPAGKKKGDAPPKLDKKPLPPV